MNIELSKLKQAKNVEFPTSYPPNTQIPLLEPYKHTFKRYIHKDYHRIRERRTKEQTISDNLDKYLSLKSNNNVENSSRKNINPTKISRPFTSSRRQTLAPSPSQHYDYERPSTVTGITFAEAMGLGCKDGLRSRSLAQEKKMKDFTSIKSNQLKFNGNFINDTLKQDYKYWNRINVDLSKMTGRDGQPFTSSRKQIDALPRGYSKYGKQSKLINSNNSKNVIEQDDTNRYIYYLDPDTGKTKRLERNKLDKSGDLLPLYNGMNDKLFLSYPPRVTSFKSTLPRFATNYAIMRNDCRVNFVNSSVPPWIGPGTFTQNIFLMGPMSDDYAYVQSESTLEQNDNNGEANGEPSTGKKKKKNKNKTSMKTKMKEQDSVPKKSRQDAVPTDPHYIKANSVHTNAYLKNCVKNDDFFSQIMNENEKDNLRRGRRFNRLKLWLQDKVPPQVSQEYEDKTEEIAAGDRTRKAYKSTANVAKDSLQLSEFRLTKEEKKDIDDEIDSLVKRITPFGKIDIV